MKGCSETVAMTALYGFSRTALSCVYLPQNTLVHLIVHTSKRRYAECSELFHPLFYRGLVWVKEAQARPL